MASGELVKKVVVCHQFHAVRVAVQETLRAARVGGRRMRGATGTSRDGMRETGRQSHRDRLARARFGQVPDYGVLHRFHRPLSGD